MTAFGPYDESYPPEVLRGYAAPLVAGAARPVPEEDDMTDPTEPTAPLPEFGPESNAPEGSVPVDATRTEPDGPAVVAVSAEQLDEAAAGAEPTSTTRSPSLHEAATAGTVGDELVDQPDADTVTEGMAEEAGVSSSGQSSDEPAARFTVTAGTPGSYEPEVGASDRPRNVTELRGSARPADPAPWPAGAYVLVGTTGKRAHWDGEDWRSGEAPAFEADAQ